MPRPATPIKEKVATKVKAKAAPKVKAKAKPKTTPKVKAKPGPKPKAKPAVVVEEPQILSAVEGPDQIVEAMSPEAMKKVEAITNQFFTDNSEHTPKNVQLKCELPQVVINQVAAGEKVIIPIPIDTGMAQMLIELSNPTEGLNTVKGRYLLGQAARELVRQGFHLKAAELKAAGNEELAKNFRKGDRPVGVGVGE